MASVGGEYIWLLFLNDKNSKACQRAEAFPISTHTTPSLLPQSVERQDSNFSKSEAHDVSTMRMFRVWSLELRMAGERT